MRKLLGLLVVVLIIGLPCGYGIHLYKNYLKIQKELHDKSSRIVQPIVDEESVSEIGYIFSMRRDTYIREGRLNLVWFIAVPAQNTRYSCSYQEGFSDFKVGDGVRIIHKKIGVDTVDYSGYIVGLHGQENGKVTDVWALDLDEMEMDIEE